LLPSIEDLTWQGGEKMDNIESAIQPRRPIKRQSTAIEAELLKLGNTIVTKFHVLMRISQIYDSKNTAIQQFVQESLQTINQWIKREGVLSILVDNELFLNGERLRYSVEGFTSFKYLLTQCRKRRIGEVVFKSPADETTLKEFIYGLMSLEDGNEKNAELFSESLASHGITSIEVHPLEVLEGEEDAITYYLVDQQKVAQKVFFETIGTIKEVITHIKGKQHADVRKLKRLAQKAVNLIVEDESILLGMATIKNYDEYTFNHSVNVTIYSLAIGKRLGFTRKIMTELGITALLHDIGKSKIPREILNKPGPLDEGEWGVMKKHPLLGVEVALNLKQLGEINPRMVVGIFDHHLNNDLSGYPKLFRKKELSLFGRIIQIADSYDAMTTARIYKKSAYTPEHSLAIMLRERVVHFDPILLKILIGVVGIYPIGSLVLLNTHEVGIVYKPNPDPKWIDRPRVILVERHEKKDVKKELIDLTETDGPNHFKRTVIKTLDPNKYHVDIAKYFLAS
jgi:HD-GYP domain-containing protein (c-di-GMP phosphodiesterase class II)